MALTDTSRRLPMRAGFTLVELMIALGIMVIGFSMLATSFPVAVVENRESINKTMSSLICQNAIAICRARFRHTDGSGGAPTLNGNATNPLLTERTGDIGKNDCVFPVPDPNEPGDWLPNTTPPQPSSRYTYLVAIRQIDPNVNNYQLAIVPCRKVMPTDSLRFDDCTVTGNKAAGVSVGSPVILKSSGEWATVYKPDGSLDRALADGAAYCVKNSKGGDSPAIGCLVTRFSTQR